MWYSKLKLNTPFRVNVQVNDLATSTNGYYRGDRQQLEIYGNNLIDGYTIDGNDGTYGVQNISGASQNNGNEIIMDELSISHLKVKNNHSLGANETIYFIGYNIQGEKQLTKTIKLMKDKNF